MFHIKLEDQRKSDNYLKPCGKKKSHPKVPGTATEGSDVQADQSGHQKFTYICERWAVSLKRVPYDKCILCTMH